MPLTDKLVLNFSTMWELLNVNCNYKLIRSSMINIAVKMIDSRHDKYPHRPQLFSSRAPALFQPSMCLISSLTVLLYDSSYNLGDDLGSLPYTHNQSFRGTDREEGSVWGVGCCGYQYLYLDLAGCFTTTMQTGPSAVHYNTVMVWYQHFQRSAQLGW